MAFCGNEKDEMVTSLACMALYDGETEITADQISVLLTATNNKVAPFWPSLFAGICADNRILEIICSGGAAPAGAGGAAAVAGGEEAAAPVEAAKPKEEEVDALEGGMDMFGGGGGGDY